VARALTPTDRAALQGLLADASAEDVRFRFPGEGQRSLERMTKVDHDRTENFCAYEESSGKMIATAMLASDATGRTAEIAIAIRAGFANRGIGWTLLDHVAGYAEAHGLDAVESMTGRDDTDVIGLETEMGFAVSALPDECVLLTKRFARTIT
jgi:ribosomal protein S18 acetylase RimI-like enzyme